LGHPRAQAYRVLDCSLIKLDVRGKAARGDHLARVPNIVDASQLDSDTATGKGILILAVELVNVVASREEYADGL